MRFSTTYVYTDQMQAVSETVSPLGVMADYNLLNLNFAWERVLESPVDLSVFVTNVADEEYKTYVIGIWPYGVEGGAVGMPRMFGARIRYNFGP
jgi:iron complex outermembrane receptor protein